MKRRKSFFCAMMGLLVLILMACSGAETPAAEEGVDTNGAGQGNASTVTSQEHFDTSTSCSDGGVRISVGIDENSNGALDTEEIDDIEEVCNGATGATGADGTSGCATLINTTTLSAGNANCPDGGSKVEAGLDVNNNNELEDAEVTSTDFICNGATGTTGATGATGETGATGSSGANGLTALINTTAESSGTNCPTGGIAVNVGVDDDGNGTLDTAEIDSSSYICNGMNAAPTAPTGLAISNTSSDRTTLSWDAAYDDIGVAGYKVYRGGSFIQNVASTSLINNGLAGSTNYCYKVSAYDASGNESAKSGEACDTTSVSGALDTTFDSDGIVTTAVGTSSDLARAVAIQPDGKIVAAGYFYNGSNTDFALVRYNTDGTPDTSFGDGDGVVTTAIGSADDSAYAVAIQSDGKIVAAGYSYIYSDEQFALVRYNTDGTLDTSFGDGDGIVITGNDIGCGNNRVSAIALQSDGKIVVAGHFSNCTYNDFAVVQYNTDGTLDTSFGGDGKVTTSIGSLPSQAYAVAIQPDGKIVAAGFSTNGGDRDIAIVRYSTNGTLDASFSGDGVFTNSISGYDYIRAIAIQTDGKIVAAGDSETANNYDIAIERFNADGTLDTSFGGGDGIVTTAIGPANDNAFAVAIQPYGRIVAAGYSSNGSNNHFALVQYNADGSLYTSFDGDGIVTTAIGAAYDGAYAVAIQSDGKIVAAGNSIDSGTDYDFALVRYMP